MTGPAPARGDPRGAPVALWQGADRSENVRRALSLVIDEIDWSAARHVVVKPNVGAPHRPLSVTHPDALDTVLTEIRRRFGGHLSVAEGSALEPTPRAFARLGIDRSAAAHGAELVDLNASRSVPVRIYGRHGASIVLRMAQVLVQSDCRVSLAVPKTHDAVLVTLSIKNVAMGALADRSLVGAGSRSTLLRRVRRLVVPTARNDRALVHQGAPVMNVNLALLAAALLPHLAIIDGFEAMEGAGPCEGTAVPWRVAFAGTKALAVDGLAAALMGFPPEEVGYLSHCAALGLGDLRPSPGDVVGNVAPEDVRRAFVPHPTHLAQRRWSSTLADGLLACAIADRAPGPSTDPQAGTRRPGPSRASVP